MVNGGILALRLYCLLCCAIKPALNTKYQLKLRIRVGGEAGGHQSEVEFSDFSFSPQKTCTRPSPMLNFLQCLRMCGPDLT